MAALIVSTLARRLKRMSRREFAAWFQRMIQDRDARAANPEEAKAADLMRHVLELTGGKKHTR